MADQPRKPNIREGESEVITTDPEREKRYEEILDLLLAAGYFRVRISTLAPFDKVVGGLAWCITNCSTDLDVDLLFQEDASLGQKIKLGDDIVKALIKMKCPLPLETYQIRGLDYVKIFPVVQWLVTNVIETRKETGNLVRLLSESQFEKDYKMPQDAELEEKKEPASKFLISVRERYKPKRRYRQGKTVRSEEERVQATLLEYGLTQKVSSRPKEEQTSSLRALQDTLGKGQEQVNEGEEEQKKIEQLMKDFVAKGETENVAASILNGIVGLQIDELREIAEAYNRQKIDIGQSDAKRFIGEEVHKKQVARLKKTILEKKEKLAEVRAQYEELQKELGALQATHAEKLAINEQLLAEIQAYSTLETEANKNDVAELRALILQNESLKAQEVKFKQACKKQYEYWTKLIEDLKAKIDRPDDDVTNRNDAIKETYDRDVEKYQKLCNMAAKRTRDISLAERKIDDVPSRTELAQYQRQFVELSEQVSAKLIETRQYYTTYNTLEDTKTALANEVSLLNSIHDNYKNAMASKSSKDQFITSLENASKQVVQSKDKYEKKYMNEKKVCDDLNDKYLQLVEKERTYYKLVKEFQEECRKNEYMLSLLNK